MHRSTSVHSTQPKTIRQPPPPRSAASPMIHEGTRADNTALRRSRHAQRSDELNHRTQAPPLPDLFPRITRVSAVAPKLVRVIRRLRPTGAGANNVRPAASGRARLNAATDR